MHGFSRQIHLIFIHTLDGPSWRVPPRSCLADPSAAQNGGMTRYLMCFGMAKNDRTETCCPLPTLLPLVGPVALRFSQFCTHDPGSTFRFSFCRAVLVQFVQYYCSTYHCYQSHHSHQTVERRSIKPVQRWQRNIDGSCCCT